jgi:uncharacterized protein YneF (UPF0154 family)
MISRTLRARVLLVAIIPLTLIAFVLSGIFISNSFHI